MHSKPSIRVAYLTVLPIMLGLWFFILILIPAQHWLFLTLSLVVTSILLIFFINRIINAVLSDLRELAEWSEAFASNKAKIEEAPFTDPEGSRIVRSLRKVAKKQANQHQKRERDKDRLETILTYMNDGVLILNKNGLIRMMNSAACDLLEISAQTAHNRTFVQVVQDHRIAGLWRVCKEENQQLMKTTEFKEKLLRVVVTPFLRGNARGFLVIFQDLTEVSRLQTVRQSFVTNISHELRTPLASVRALAETLRDGALEDPPAARRFLDRMEIEVDALTGLVQELFDLSRIESGQMDLHFNSMAPAKIITPSVERLTSQAERAQILLSVDVPEDLPTVSVDRERIEQVMVNLVHNAIRFTPPSGSIHVSARQQNGHLMVSVKDTGSGIADEHLPRIFERFYKADSSRRSGGSGLGLAISKHIVHAHQGTIWAESVEGKGSTFSFTLPVTVQSEN
ncbi:MAG: ATP-binding protein [Chloroflexota bacterium]